MLPPEKPATSASYKVTFSLIWKVMAAMLITGLIPLPVIAFAAFISSSRAAQNATEIAKTSLDDKSLEIFLLQVQQASQAVSAILNNAAKDTRNFVLLPRTPATYLAFSVKHHSDLIYDNGPDGVPLKATLTLPVYSELTYIDATGQERIRIVNDQIVPTADLRDVSDPANTTFLVEDYFSQTRVLKEGELYISPVMTWHASTAKQPGGVSNTHKGDGTRYADYLAVTRFATPVFTPDGTFDGIVMLTLDHRHLMEPVIHIIPTDHGNAWTLWPDYTTGNYAYMWDDEGFLISHPLLARLRGLDETGHMISPLLTEMSATEKLLHPFQMQTSNVKDAKPMYEEVSLGHQGVRRNLSQGGVEKANVYTPVWFKEGRFASTGIFGGIVVGANLVEFHKPAITIGDQMAAEQDQLKTNTYLIVGASIVLLGIISLLFASALTRPIRRLTHAAERIGEGDYEQDLTHISSARFHDEINSLAHVFTIMVGKVRKREETLVQQVAELKIEIDEAKREKQVSEIVGTEYFQDLRAKAASMRGRPRRGSKSDAPAETAPVEPSGDTPATTTPASGA